MYYILWTFLLISATSCQATEITTSPVTNVTTLYPVSNKTIIRNDIKINPNDTDTRPRDNNTKPNDTDTIPKDTDTTHNDSSTTQIENGTRSNATETKPKAYPQSWKIESAYAESNLTEKDSDMKEGKEKGVADMQEEMEKKEVLKDFKPSQHLGSFFDGAEVIRTPMYEPVEKKPASGFVSSPKDDSIKYPKNHHTFNKIPKEIYYTHEEFPYKFEDTIFTRTKEGWHDSLESQPTMEVPVNVPAGGLYKFPEAFKEKPHSEENFAMEIHEVDDEQQHAVKKRGNPWQNLLRIMTAFIPVGLIISALTPSIITIHNVDDSQQSPSLPYRRSDTGVSHIVPISEQCRRRLLCELRSERNYAPPSSFPRRNRKHCYKIHCEDIEALWRMLRWLFMYHRGADDQKGRHIT